MALVANRTIGRMAYSAGAEDDHGDVAKSWAAAVDVDVFAWFAATDETNSNGRTAETADLTVLLPAGSGFVAKDRAVVDSETYEVIGDLESFDVGIADYAPGDRLMLRKVKG